MHVGIRSAIIESLVPCYTIQKNISMPARVQESPRQPRVEMLPFDARLHSAPNPSAIPNWDSEYLQNDSRKPAIPL